MGTASSARPAHPVAKHRAAAAAITALAAAFGTTSREAGSPHRKHLLVMTSTHSLQHTWPPASQATCIHTQCIRTSRQCMESYSYRARQNNAGCVGIARNTPTHDIDDTVRQWLHEDIHREATSRHSAHFVENAGSTPSRSAVSSSVLSI